MIIWLQWYENLQSHALPQVHTSLLFNVILTFSHDGKTVESWMIINQLEFRRLKEQRHNNIRFGRFTKPGPPIFAPPPTPNIQWSLRVGSDVLDNKSQLSVKYNITVQKCVIFGISWHFCIKGQLVESSYEVCAGSSHTLTCAPQKWNCLPLMDTACSVIKMNIGSIDMRIDW